MVMATAQQPATAAATAAAAHKLKHKYKCVFTLYTETDFLLGTVRTRLC